MRKPRPTAVKWLPHYTLSRWGFLTIYLFWETVRIRVLRCGQWDRGRESWANRLPAECGAELSPTTHEIRTWAETKSRQAPLYCKFLRNRKPWPVWLISQESALVCRGWEVIIEGGGSAKVEVCVEGGQRGSKDFLRMECGFCLLVNCGIKGLVPVFTAPFVGRELNKSHWRGNEISYEILKCFGKFTRSIFGIHPIFFLISISLLFFFLASVFSCFLYFFLIKFQFEEVGKLWKHLYEIQISFFLYIFQYLLIPGKHKVILMKNI